MAIFSQDMHVNLTRIRRCISGLGLQETLWGYVGKSRTIPNWPEVFHESSGLQRAKNAVLRAAQFDARLLRFLLAQTPCQVSLHLLMKAHAMLST